MKSLCNAILDGLTFKDIAGKRQPRSYVVLTGLILLLILLLASCVALERNAMMDEVRGTPETVRITSEPVTTEAPATDITEPCPSNPADWTFVEVLSGDNFQRIAESCVYDGLAKSVAWALAVRSGYTREAATQTLGFSATPLELVNEVITITNTQGPASALVTFTPPHPDFAEWRVDSEGVPAIAYALRGCFRTSRVIGNQSQSWNEDYPVLCVLSEDSTASFVTVALDGHVYTSEAEPMRTFSLFGYRGMGEWVWLGTRQEPKVPLAKLKDFQIEAQAASGLYGAELWDVAWLGHSFGLEPQLLPDNWQNTQSDADLKIIMNELNRYLVEVQQ